MSSSTPNIGLTLPTGGERVSRQIINENNTKIDTHVGELYEQIGTLNSKIKQYDMTTTTKIQTYSNKTAGDGFITYNITEDGWYYLNGISLNASYPVDLCMSLANNSNRDFGFNAYAPAGNASDWHIASTQPMYIKSGQSVYIIPAGSTVYLMKAANLT